MILLETVIMRVESSGFTGAIRFEDSAYRTQPVDGPTIGAISHANRCNYNTAHAIYWTSYGLFQILGMTLYSTLGFQQPVASFWIDSEQQITQFRALVTKFGIDPHNFDFTDEGLLERFATRYNGPGNVPGYVAAIKAAYQAISQEAT